MQGRRQVRIGPAVQFAIRRCDYRTGIALTADSCGQGARLWE